MTGIIPKRPIKIFGYFNGMQKQGGNVMVTSMTEHGRTLFSYFVPDEKTGRYMLGMDGVTRNNWERYQDMVGPFTLEWVPFSETATHIGLKRAVQKYLLNGGKPYGE